MVLFLYLEARGSRFILNVGTYIPEKKIPNLHENSQLGQTVSGPRLELGISQIRIRGANHSPATFSNAENEDEVTSRTIAVYNTGVQMETGKCRHASH
jgi:hypothetical protein